VVLTAEVLVEVDSLVVEAEEQAIAIQITLVAQVEADTLVAVAVVAGVALVPVVVVWQALVVLLVQMVRIAWAVAEVELQD
jgi:hypothetical protein